MKMPEISFKSIAASFQTRAFRVGGYSVAAAIIVLAIAVAANLLAGALPAEMTQLDMTSNQLFSISQQTQKLVSGLDTEVTIYWIVQADAEDTVVEKLLSHYESLSNMVTVEKRDPDVYPTFAQQYTTETVYNNSLIVVAGERSSYVSYEEIYVYDYTNYYTDGSYTVNFDGEGALTSAIDYVLSEDLPKLYTLTGHGESTLGDTFSSAVEKENIQTAQLSLLTLEAVPEDADCIVIYCPQSDIAQEEKELLETYLASGGNLILITDPPEEDSLPNLEALMESYGVTAQPGLVVEGNQNNYAWGTPYYLLPDMNTHTVTDPLIQGGYYVLLPIAQGLRISSDLRDGLSVTQLLTTSNSAFSKIAGYGLTTFEKEDGDVDGPFALAVAIEDTAQDGTVSNLIWVSSGALLDEQTNTQVSGGNQDLFLNMVNFLCEPEGSSIAIHSKSLSTDYLTMSSGTATMISICILAIIPLGYLAVGICIWVRRKRR